VKFHPERDALTLELHERPFQPMAAPLRVSHLAVGAGEHGAEQDRAQLVELCRRYGAAHPGPEVKHFTADLGSFLVKWERHTEFSTYTFLREEPFDEPFDETVFDLVPQEWKDSLPGDVVVAIHMAIKEDRSETIEPNRLSRWFDGNPVFADRLGDDLAEIYGDLRTGDDKFERFLVRVGEVEPALLGQLVQRVLEVVTYSRLSLLALPIARSTSPRLAGVEAGLAEVAAQLARHDRVPDDEALLDKLSTISADLEDVVGASSYRYSASQAYYEIVGNRLRNLAPIHVPGQITLFGYLMRRVDPAMSTCQSMVNRQEALSRRANRLSSLLQTGIEVRLEAQNRDLLRSMNRRAEQAITLQRTVEGLSVVAVTYYGLSLLEKLFKGLDEAGTLPVDPDLATAVALPLVALGFWSLIRYLTRHIRHAPPEG